MQLRSRNLVTMLAGVGMMLALLMAVSGPVHAQWVSVGGSPNASTCMLLTDASVLCQNGEQSKSWRRLTPHAGDGKYETGTWTNMDDLPQPGVGYAPLYYASGVLADGRVFVIGGEYNNSDLSCGSTTNCPTKLGYILDPTKPSGSQWSGPITVPGGYSGSDNQGVILANGTVLVADINSKNIFKLDPNALTLTLVGGTGKDDNNDEEGWHLLPGGNVLTVDAVISSRSEVYDPVANSWAAAVNTQVNLADIGNGAGAANSAEVGPGVLRPDGSFINFGGNVNGGNAIYSTAGNTWLTAVSFPGNLTVADGPAAILRNGNVLVEAAPGVTVVAGKNSFGTGSKFFEFDTNVATTPVGNLTDVSAGGPSVGGEASFHGRMLVLPTGEILFTHGGSDVWLYTNTGNPQDAWRPTITGAPNSVNPASSYTISGTQFNGLSQGGSYGDDAQMASNYPIIRIVNRGTGHVFYARTHDHSSMGVATGSAIVSTTFDTPAGLEAGLSDLFVVANGIPSKAYVLNGPGLSIPGPLSMNTCINTTTTTTLNICNTGKQDLSISSITSSNAQISVTTPSSGYSVTISPDFCFPFQVKYAPTTAGPLTATLTVNSNDPNTPAAPVQVTANAPAPSIVSTIVSGGNFGDVCLANQTNLSLQITNQSVCDLVVSSVVSSKPAEFLPPSVNLLPITLVGNSTVSLPVTFQPVGATSTCNDTAPRTGTITVNSNDPAKPSLIQNVAGIVPCPKLNATIANTGSFGNVCAANQSDLNLQLLNQGKCNLTVSSIGMTNLTDFVPPSVQLPLVLSHDANVNLPIRFKPTTACSDTVDKTSQVIVVSDDPSKPPTGFSQNVSGKEGCPKLTLSPTNLTGAFAFPATVSDPNGTLGCYTDRQVSIGNSGICPLNITAITVNPNVSNAFSVINPTVPVSIGPGAAPVKVTVRFKPVILAGQINNAPDQQTGTLTIASNDPVSADNSAALCGEPTVQSGARILVVDSTTSPVSSVKSLNLNSSGLHPGVNQTLSPAKLVTANNICGNTIKYHLDNELLPPAGTTGNSPNSSYSLSAKQNSTQANMSFTLGQCEVKQVVLQIK